MGQLVTLDGANEFTNDFTRPEIDGFNWAGIEAGLLYDRRTDQNDDVDNTMRATFGTNLLGADIEATVHNRAKRPVVDGCRRSEAHLGDGQARGQPSCCRCSSRGGLVAARRRPPPTSHTYIGVSVDKYPVGPLRVQRRLLDVE